MRYLLAEWTHQEEDEPYLLYSEMDEERRETRRVEFYRNGITFSYGGERGNEGALRQEPFPEDLRDLLGTSSPRRRRRRGSSPPRRFPRGCSMRFGIRPRSAPTGLWGCFFEHV